MVVHNMLRINRMVVDMIILYLMYPRQFLSNELNFYEELK